MTKELETELDPQTISEAAGPRPGSMLRAMSYANLDAEKVLRGFGTFGAYQMFVYAMANLGFFFFACETMIFSLIMEEPEFICTSPGDVNWTLNQCEYTIPETNVTTKCSSFSYTKDKHTFLTSEFDLVCDDANKGEHSVSIFMIGSMVFTPILTQLADLYGRRITYLVPLWLAIFSNIGCAFASNYLLFLIFRFLAGVGTAGVGTIGFVIMLETIAPTFRSHTALVSTVVWVAGYTTVGIAHIYIESWKWQFIILVSPFTLTIVYYWLLPESIHWMITHKKIKGVTSWIETSSRFNNKELNLEGCKSSASSTPDTNSEIDSHKRTFLDIFKNGPMVFQLISHCYIMIVMNFTYWALSLSSTELHENKMIGYFLSGFAELPAGAAMFLLAYYGRRSVTSISLFAQAIAMFIATFYPGTNPVAMTLFLLVKVFNCVAWLAEPLLIGEMSPTSTRNMFYGVIGFVGEIGSIIAPYFERLKDIHESAPAFAVAVLSFIAGLLALCSPETMNVPMPEDIDDFDPGVVYCWIFGKPRKNNRAQDIDINATEKNSFPLLETIQEEATEN